MDAKDTLCVVLVDICVSLPLIVPNVILYDFLRCVSYYHFFDCNFLRLQSFYLSLHHRFFQTFGYYEQYDCQISHLSVWPEVFYCIYSITVAIELEDIFSGPFLR